MIDHILQDSPENSTWISTSKALDVAQYFARFGADYGGFIVKINRCKVNSEVLDVSSGSLGDPIADGLAVNERQVLILNFIPPSAISIEQVGR